MLNKNDGFTLVEVLLSLAIFAIIGITLTSAFMNGAHGLQLSQRRSQDLNTAQLRINEAILNYDNSDTDTITVVFNQGKSDQVSITVDGMLIQEEINGVLLEYFEVVMPDA